MALPTDPEQIERLGKAYKEIQSIMENSNSAMKDLSTVQHMQLTSLANYLRMLEQQNDLYEQQSQHLERMRKNLPADASKATEQQKAQIDYITENIKKLEKMKKMRDLHFKERVKQMKFVEKLQKEIRDEVDKGAGGANKADKEFERISKDRTIAYKREIGTLRTWRDVGTAAVAGVVGAGEGALKVFNSVEGDLAKLTAIMGTGFTVGTLRLEMQSAFKSLERGWKDFVKNTGLATKELKLTYASIIDPLDAVRDGLLDFEKVGLKPLINIGVTGPEAGAAMTSLSDNVSYFRQGWVKMNPEIAAFTGNLVAGLKKIGVALPSSTKLLDGFVKVFGQTPKAATDTVKQLVNVADTLGINVGGAIQDFNANMGNLAQWGENAVEVFADLQAQAVATGSKFGDLVKITDRLDTFKGAAEAAQTFNAVVGNTVLSVTDLAMASPSEKINMLRDAMDRSGISFETANRRVKKIIATMLGTDVAGAARIFGSKEDFEIAKKNMDTSAISQEKLKKRIHESMTSMERMKASLSSMAGGMFKVMDKVNAAAAQVANTVTNTYGDLLKNTKNSQAAGLQMLGIFRAFDTPLVSAASRIKGMVEIMEEFVKQNFPDLGSVDRKKLMEKLKTKLKAQPTALAGGGTGLGDVNEAASRREQELLRAGLPGTLVADAGGGGESVDVKISFNLDNTEVATQMGKIALGVVDNKIRSAVYSANA
tara:strand:+ start:994 stop:3126 length:2133 start_codon:yes stop_codon:yes gene_type:complete